MSARMFKHNGVVHILSNVQSILNAGFVRSPKSFYNKSGETVTYFVHPCGCVLARWTVRRGQPIIRVYDSKETANRDFLRINGMYENFADGKYVLKR